MRASNVRALIELKNSTLKNIPDTSTESRRVRAGIVAEIRMLQAIADDIEAISRS